MRWIAGVVYALLFTYQLYLVKIVLEMANLSNAYILWLGALLLMVGAGAMTVWMFHGREQLSPSSQRAIVSGTILCIIFELMTYSGQTELIKYAVYNVFPDQVENTTLLYALMVARLLIMIFAAFVVTSTPPKVKDMLEVDEESEDSEELDDAEEVDEISEVEIIEEVVIEIESEDKKED